MNRAFEIGSFLRPIATASNARSAPATPFAGSLALANMRCSYAPPTEPLTLSVVKAAGSAFAVSSGEVEAAAFSPVLPADPTVTSSVALHPTGHSATGHAVHDRLSPSGFCATRAVRVCVPAEPSL